MDLRARVIAWREANGLPPPRIARPEDLEVPDPVVAAGGEILKPEAAAISELDLVFLCDCTGSMGTYIRVAQQNITSIAKELSQKAQHDLRFALVCYRDHPPAELSYATRVFEFTSSLDDMNRNVGTMKAQGGGDTPESVACALHAALRLPWRPNSVKLVVCISDAPPHGLGFCDDTFPDGCPCGVDPVVTVHAMRDKGIVLYTIGCEPLIGQTAGTREFFKGLADITGGRYLSLHDAKLLPAIIVGGAEEEAALQRLNAAVEEEIQNVRSAAPGLRDEEVFQVAADNCAKKNLVAPQMEMDMQQHIPMSSCVERSACLRDAQQSLKSNATLLSAAASASSPSVIAGDMSSAMPAMYLAPPAPSSDHYAPGMAFGMAFAAPQPMRAPPAPGGGGAAMPPPAHQNCSFKMASLSSDQIARISKKGSPSPFSK